MLATRLHSQTLPFYFFAPFSLLLFYLVAAFCCYYCRSKAFNHLGPRVHNTYTNKQTTIYTYKVICKYIYIHT